VRDGDRREYLTTCVCSDRRVGIGPKSVTGKEWLCGIGDKGIGRGCYPQNDGEALARH